MDRSPALAASGVIATVVTLAGVLVATLVSTSFVWTRNALSDLGVATTDAGTETTVLLFNGGLVLGGLLGIVFASYLYTRAASRGKRVVAGLFAITMLTMAGIGIFPQDTAVHLPVAVAFYLLVTATIWGDAVAVRGTEEGRRGAVAAWLGAVNVLAWAVWAATGPVRRPGLAIPEVVGALVLAAWVLSTAIRLSRWEPAVSRSPAR
jgi:hypothetical membrane protein